MGCPVMLFTHTNAVGGKLQGLSVVAEGNACAVVREAREYNKSSTRGTKLTKVRLNNLPPKKRVESKNLKVRKDWNVSRFAEYARPLALSSLARSPIFQTLLHSPGSKVVYKVAGAYAFKKKQIFLFVSKIRRMPVHFKHAVGQLS